MTVLRLWVLCVLLNVAAPLACQPGGGDFRDSFEASGLSPAWQALDVGGISVSRAVRSGALRVSAVGGAVGGERDAVGLTIVSPGTQGSFAAVVRLASLTKTVGKPSAGLMARASGDPDAPFVCLGANGDRTTAVSLRTRKGEPAAVHQGPAADRPLWLRLARVGPRFLCGVSTDGVHYRSLLDEDVPIQEGLLLGLYVCSGEDGKSATAVFDDFSLEVLGRGATGDVLARVHAPGSGELWWPYVTLTIPGVDHEWRGTADDRGFVWFHAVPPGPGCLQVTCAGHRQLSRDVLVKPGEIISADLEPAPLPSLVLGADAGWRLKLIGAVSAETDAVDLSMEDQTAEGWSDCAVPLSWSALKLPPWQYGWYQLHVDVPQSWREFAGYALLLDGLVFDGSDWVYWNGRLVGRRLRDRSGVRRYVIPAGVWRTGMNVLAVRGMSENGDGGAGGITSERTVVRVLGPFGAVEGRVLDACGGPAPGVLVTAECADTEYGPVRAETETELNGKFAIPGLPAGRYSIVVRTEGRPGGDAQVEVPGVVVRAGESTDVEAHTELAPTLALVAEAGHNWSILVGGVDASADHSTVDDPEAGFVPLAVTEDHGAWGMLDTDSRSYAWLRLRLQVPKRWGLQYKGDLCLWGYDFDDVDRAFVNGVLVGQTGRFPHDERGYQGEADRRRRYTVPESAVRFGGENLIAIQGYKALGQGGFRNWRPLLTPLAVSSAPGDMVPGDANGDGQVTVADAVLVLRAALGGCELRPEQILAGDVDCDGDLSVGDAVRILRMALEPSAGVSARARDA